MTTRADAETAVRAALDASGPMPLECALRSMADIVRVSGVEGSTFPVDALRACVTTVLTEAIATPVWTAALHCLDALADAVHMECAYPRDWQALARCPPESVIELRRALQSAALCTALARVATATVSTDTALQAWRVLEHVGLVVDPLFFMLDKPMCDEIEAALVHSIGARDERVVAAALRVLRARAVWSIAAFVDNHSDRDTLNRLLASRGPALAPLVDVLYTDASWDRLDDCILMYGNDDDRASPGVLCGTVPALVAVLRDCAVLHGCDSGVAPCDASRATDLVARALVADFACGGDDCSAEGPIAYDAAMLASLADSLLVLASRVAEIGAGPAAGVAHCIVALCHCGLVSVVDTFVARGGVHALALARVRVAGTCAAALDRGLVAVLTAHALPVAVKGAAAASLAPCTGDLVRALVTSSASWRAVGALGALALCIGAAALAPALTSALEPLAVEALSHLGDTLRGELILAKEAQHPASRGTRALHLLRTLACAAPASTAAATLVVAAAATRKTIHVLLQVARRAAEVGDAEHVDGAAAVVCVIVAHSTSAAPAAVRAAWGAHRDLLHMAAASPHLASLAAMLRAGEEAGVRAAEA